MSEIKDPSPSQTPLTGKDQGAADLSPRDPVREERRAHLRDALISINPDSLTSGIRLMLARTFVVQKGFIVKTPVLNVTSIELSSFFDYRVADPLSGNFPEVNRATLAFILDAFALRAHRESIDQPADAPSDRSKLIPIVGVCGQNSEAVDSIGYHIKNFLPQVAIHPSKAPELEVEMWENLKGLNKVLQNTDNSARKEALQVAYSLFARTALVAAIFEAKGKPTAFFANSEEAATYLDRFLESAVR